MKPKITTIEEMAPDENGKCYRLIIDGKKYYALPMSD